MRSNSMRVLLLAAACCGAAAARQLASAAAVGDAVTTILPPFSTLDVGFSACMPLSVSVVSGTAFALVVDGEVAPHIGATVAAGVCTLKVLSSFEGATGSNITITVPDGKLQGLHLGDAANAYISAAPGPQFTLNSIGQGWVKVEPAAPLAGSVLVSSSGNGDVALCPTSASLRYLSILNTGLGAILASNMPSGRTALELRGTGPVYVTGTAAPGSSVNVNLKGGASVVASAESASVELTGMGDVYLSGTTHVTGFLSGMGQVHVPEGTSCLITVTGMGGCDYSPVTPPQTAFCDDHSADDIADANAGPWTVTISPDGMSCQSHSQAAVDNVMHGHRVPEPCCTTGFVHSGTHCESNGEHHRCCVDGGEWTCHAPPPAPNNKLAEAEAAIVAAVQEA